MKKFLTLAIFLFLGISYHVQAQFQVGGALGFSKQNDLEEVGGDETEATTTDFTISPRLGYVFNDFWAGVDVSFNGTKTEETQFPGTDHYVTKTNLTSISPFFRYTKNPIQNMGIWIEAQAGASFGKNSVEGVTQRNYNGFNAGLRPGVIFYVGNRLSFEASFGRLGYSQFTVKDDQNPRDKETISRFGFGLNNNNIGIDISNTSIVSGFLFGVNWKFADNETEK